MVHRTYNSNSMIIVPISEVLLGGPFHRSTPTNPYSLMFNCLSQPRSRPTEEIGSVLHHTYIDIILNIAAKISGH